MTEDFLVVGDLHLDSRSPGIRNDDYWQTCQDRLEDVESVARDNDIDIAVHLGDVFNRVTVPSSFIADVMTWFKQSDLDHYAISGNHDQRHARISDLNRTPIWLLFQSGALKNIARFDDEGNREELSERIGFDVVAEHYLNSFDSASEAFNKPESQPSVLFCHQYSEQMWNSSNHLTDDIIKEFSLVFCGHDHTTSEKTVDGTDVVTPGSLTRMTASFEDRMRDIYVASAGFEDGSPWYDLIRVDEGPFEDEYDENALDDLQRKKDLSSYVESLEDRSEDLQSASDLDSVIDSFDLDDDVESMVREKFTEKGLL